VFKLVNVSKTYLYNGVETRALKNINLELPSSGLVFVLGNSGSGKSTLLNCMSGLDKVTAGNIYFDGNALNNFDSAELNSYRRNFVGFVAQDYNLLTDLSVGKNLELVARLKGIDKKDINLLLEKVGLNNYYDSSVKNLSGGQKQRVVIARAMVASPKIIFADEPTGNLDGDNGKAILQLLKELSKDTLVVVVSHNVDYAYKFGDRVVKLEDGSIVSDELINKYAQFVR